MRQNHELWVAVQAGRGVCTCCRKIRERKVHDYIYLLYDLSIECSSGISACVYLPIYMSIFPRGLGRQRLMKFPRRRARIRHTHTDRQTGKERGRGERGAGGRYGWAGRENCIECRFCTLNSLNMGTRVCKRSYCVRQCQVCTPDCTPGVCT